ncbi:unnamed protein product [Adineta steineri]|uniref:Uncharacterized protein n=1 Tax=Adineta steineri TaxID=433720 RepID=A0A815RJ43_9BILA|nr:unnamed protein product [Adineta steineri]CAF1478274.1 unnamed protein product [Adineta steineri]CAF3525976.1 unnamed protein product [Adineta steineri]CAF3966857.1 unnamed protein product [Adineta steineri]CAF4131608.1 unnamed protein product [Adineta steineri]
MSCNNVQQNDEVDRITLVTTNTNREYVRSHCGITNVWSVITKLYVQWVTTDSFCNGRPPLELLSFPPYKCMKMHLIQEFVIIVCNEVTPTLHSVSGTNLEQ